jgi:hypothetical protein
LSLPLEPIHHSLAVHKEQSESHEFQILRHLPIFIQASPNNNITSPQSFRKPSSRNAKSTNNSRPIPSDISPRSAIATYETTYSQPIPLPSKQQWVSCGLKASAESTLVSIPFPRTRLPISVACFTLESPRAPVPLGLLHPSMLYVHETQHSKANTTIGGGVVVDKHGMRRAPFRFSFKGLNCFK